MKYSMKKPFELYYLYNENKKKPRQIKGLSDLFSLGKNTRVSILAPAPAPEPKSGNATTKGDITSSKIKVNQKKFFLTEHIDYGRLDDRSFQMISDIENLGKRVRTFRPNYVPIDSMFLELRDNFQMTAAHYAEYFGNSEVLPFLGMKRTIWNLTKGKKKFGFSGLITPATKGLTAEKELELKLQQEEEKRKRQEEEAEEARLREIEAKKKAHKNLLTNITEKSVQEIDENMLLLKAIRRNNLGAVEDILSSGANPAIRNR
jgi:hypothetical protein